MRHLVRLVLLFLLCAGCTGTRHLVEDAPTEPETGVAPDPDVGSPDTAIPEYPTDSAPEIRLVLPDVEVPSELPDVSVKPDLAPEVPEVSVEPDLGFDSEVEVEVSTYECEPGEGCFADQCLDNGDCQSGWCIMHMGQGVCTSSCLEECPTGWTCKQVATSDPDVVYICVSDYANLCRPCAGSEDCLAVTGAPAACVSHGQEGSFCGGDCGYDEECPWGFSCLDVVTEEGVQLKQCVNDAGVCPCTDTSVALGLWTPCYIDSEWGSCQGKRVCTEAGLSACDALTPTQEKCNGVDDDCDGEVDDPNLVEGDYVNICNDDNDCTDDSCQGEDGCEHMVLSGPECLDGLACTVADHCEEGACVGTPVLCDDGNSCTDDSCSETFGCVYENNDADCDDGDPCTIADHCLGGWCIGVNLPCECITNADCADLEDGDLCNGVLYCDVDVLPFTCVVDPGSVVACPAPIGPGAYCLQAHCDPATTECSFAPDHEGLPCGAEPGWTCVGGECLLD